jgi:DHA2 family multidrug resistance protein
MAPIPKRDTGYATSLYSVMRNIGASCGISFVTTYLARQSQLHQAILTAHVTPYDLPYQQVLGATQGLLMNRGADTTTAARQATATIYGMVQRQASLLSFNEAFRVMAVLFVLCVALVVLIRKPKGHLKHEMVAE